MHFPLTDTERRLLQHVSMFGSDGYPLKKLRGKWTWGTDEVRGPPTMFNRKQDAVASFERWLDAKREALGQEAQARTLAELRAAGVSEEEIQRRVLEARSRSSWLARRDASTGPAPENDMHKHNPTKDDLLTLLAKVEEALSKNREHNPRDLGPSQLLVSIREALNLPTGKK